jgi:two-component SAPR family response regulator
MSRVVLVAEDSAAIALALEDMLTDAGFLVAGPFSRCADAVAWLATKHPDYALVDVELADGSCRDLATRLLARNIPTAFLSAWEENAYADVRNVMPKAPWVEKPMTEATIFETLRQLGA